MLRSTIRTKIPMAPAQKKGSISSPKPLRAAGGLPAPPPRQHHPLFPRRPLRSRLPPGSPTPKHPPHQIPGHPPPQTLRRPPPPTYPLPSRRRPIPPLPPLLSPPPPKPLPPPNVGPRGPAPYRNEQISTPRLSNPNSDDSAGRRKNRPASVALIGPLRV